MTLGGSDVHVMAGPCSVESREQLFAVAESTSRAGARFLRGGAFKPRTSPYSFQGLGEEGLKLLREAGDKFNMLVVSEVMEISQIALMLPYVDVLQVGTTVYVGRSSRTNSCTTYGRRTTTPSCCRAGR